ncbi:hypothetical protein Patl1_10927 [Pistacia atlantica]|uniref:Uncharacterized protein n=1 Tax=Pistacia atlantica TaxID=434234 RepID=A0ACC1A4I1_9ROSI|nr:hypothetical protein Patl1_10927 [Pistacia atlantica]
MLHLYYNLHRPSPPLRVKFNLNEGFVKITKILIVVKNKKSERSSGEGSSGEKWVHEWFITKSLSNGMFRVRLDNEDLILGYISGKIRVKVEVNRYDTSKGRIIYRIRNRSSNS